MLKLNMLKISIKIYSRIIENCWLFSFYFELKFSVTHDREILQHKENMIFLTLK